MLGLLVSTLAITACSSYDEDVPDRFGIENEDGVTIYYKYKDGDEVYVRSDDYYYSGDVNIPNKVIYKNKTLKVVGIFNNAFSHCTGLTSVTIPNSVKVIGKAAFYKCERLITLTIPNSVDSIGESAFSGCTGLTSVTIPYFIIKIERGTFENCNRLKSVDIGNYVTHIGSNAFQNCSSLTSITIPNSVTSIGYDAFSGCSGLTSIMIPNSVTSIQDNAFDGCDALKSVTIPEYVTKIGYRAFYAKNLKQVISLITDPQRIDHVFSDNMIENGTLIVPKGTIDKYRATAGWKQINNIVENSE